MGGLVEIYFLHMRIEWKYYCVYDTHAQNSVAMQPLRPYEKLNTLPKMATIWLMTEVVKRQQKDWVVS